MKVKKYRDDHFITIRLSKVELIRLSRIVSEGIDVLHAKGNFLPIDNLIYYDIDDYFK